MPHKFLIEERNGYQTTVFEPEDVPFECSADGAVPLEVEAGGIVLFDGNFTHFSYKNESDS